MEGTLRSLLAFPLFLALASPSLFGDQVVFKNGDRLSGAILKSDAKNFVIRTVVAGEVTASWQEIQELRSDQTLHNPAGNAGDRDRSGRSRSHKGECRGCAERHRAACFREISAWGLSTWVGRRFGRRA